MDDFSLQGVELERTLDGLSVINKFLGNTDATLSSVIEVLANNSGELTIVDLGCGGGDNLREIGKWCFKNNRIINLIGIDGNPNILEFAKSKVGISIEYIQGDILSPNFRLPECDILISSHFMYHFSDAELVRFIDSCKSKVTTEIIFSELVRSSFAYSLFKYMGFLLPFSSMVKNDGLLAISRSFRKNELKSIMQKTKFTQYTIKSKWAFRCLLTINTN